jgi:membrane protease YdiL (CAAX protease family)
VGFLQFITHKLLGISYLDSNTNNLSGFQFLIIELFSSIGTIGLVFVFWRRYVNMPIANIGLSKNNLYYFIFWGVLLGFLYIAAVCFVQFFIKQISFKSLELNWPDILCYLLLFILVAITEEVLIRGYVLRNLMYSFNKKIALIISSLIFALMHIGNDYISLVSLVYLFLFGIVMGIASIETSSLWFPIAFHFSWNFFQGPIFGFRVSGIQVNSIMKINILSPNLLNGGNFGIEGSIIAFLTIPLTLVVYKLLFKSNKTTT